MAINTIGKRRSALNFFIPFFRNGPYPDGDLSNAPDRRQMLNHYSGFSSIVTAKTVYLFDVRIMNRAISESGGKAVGNNLGTVSYIYDDMKNNEGKVHLPYG